MTTFTTTSGETFEAALHEFIYIGGAPENQTSYRGKKIFLDIASGKILRADIWRRCDEYEKAKELREIIWAS